MGHITHHAIVVTSWKRMKLSIYNIHNTVGDQFADVEAPSGDKALEIFRLLKGDRPGLRAYKCQGNDVVSRDFIRYFRAGVKIEAGRYPTGQKEGEE